MITFAINLENDMARENNVDISNLSPQDRLALIKKLQEDQREYERENLLKVKEEFQAMAMERGFTLGQLNLAGKASRKGLKLGPRKKSEG
jgi:hypothetical protein